MFIDHIAKSVINKDGELLMRGTKEWDDREEERVDFGSAWCKSFGPVEISLQTRGFSSTVRRSKYKPMKRLYNAAR